MFDHFIVAIILMDAAIINFLEDSCQRFQVWSGGKTNFWIANQLCCLELFAFVTIGGWLVLDGSLLPLFLNIPFLRKLLELRTLAVVCETNCKKWVSSGALN